MSTKAKIPNPLHGTFIYDTAAGVTYSRRDVRRSTCRHRNKSDKINVARKATKKYSLKQYRSTTTKYNKLRAENNYISNTSWD